MDTNLVVEQTIDGKSIASHCLVLYAYSRSVSTATGFFVQVDGINLLITNYHVVSGRNPDTGLQMANTIPDRILIPVLRRDTGYWRPVVQRLLVDGEATWIEHPILRRKFDVVALPVTLSPDEDWSISPYPMDPGPDIAVSTGSTVVIIGFPQGMSGVGLTALWIGGIVASEPNVLEDNENFFWIDANTRHGMSGSPVVARRFGAVLQPGGTVGMWNGIVDRSLGVYAGRASPDMTLGRVWKWSRVMELVDAAVAKCRRGLSNPHPCEIGFYSQPDRKMVKFNVLQTVDIPIRNAAGAVQLQRVSLADAIMQTTLSDGRFGTDIERLKMSAAIAAAVEAAKSRDGVVELEDDQYALMREAVAMPTNPYNPAVARHMLPLFQSLLDAGQQS
jgi:Trypsin-like peptidase domain